MLPGLAVLALVALAAACWRRRPHWSWLGAVFFLLLAPTSTVLPIVTEIVAERRMYVPLLAVVVPAVLAAHRLGARVGTWLAPLLVGAATLALALTTRAHAPTYANERTFWQHAFDRRDPASRSHLAAQILSNQGAMLHAAGRLDEAAALFDQAMECEQPTVVERTHYATSLQHRGRHAEAVAVLEGVLAERPGFPDALAVLGTALLMEFEKAPGGPNDPRLQRAVELLRQGTAVAPHRVDMWNSLGAGYDRQGRVADAELAFRRATELPFQRLDPFLSRAEALRRLGRTAEIGPMWQALLASRPRDVELRGKLAGIALQANDRAAARALLEEVLRIEPGHPDATQALRRLGASR